MGTPSCGGTLTPGTLNTGNVRYTQTNSYDVLDRLTTGPLGSGYTYGDTTHLDGVTSAPTYSASYDAAGSMTGRNGQVLGYDALRRLVTWQNQATNPTQTASYAYNGSGERVQQSVTSGGATTITSYIGSYEDIATTGGTTTTTKYYQMGKVGTAEAVNGTLYYQIADDLGSVAATLTASGGVQATELYDPFGYVRYTNGTMPTSYGFTKMRQDPSGLNYDHARYYDAGVGQFVTADYVQGPNRYAYVGGNPETITDPSGNCWPICAIVAAVATAVVATAVSAVVQAVSNPNHSINWGQAVTTGVTAGVAVGAVLLNPALAVGVYAGAIAGGTEGLVNGVVAHHNVGQIFSDTLTGASLGGAAGAVTGSLGLAGTLLGAGAKIGDGLFANVAGNFVGSVGSQIDNHGFDLGKWDWWNVGMSIPLGFAGWSSAAFVSGEAAINIAAAGISSGLDFVNGLAEDRVHHGQSLFPSAHTTPSKNTSQTSAIGSGSYVGRSGGLRFF